jgi:hypothetical protein
MTESRTMTFGLLDAIRHSKRNVVDTPEGTRNPGVLTFETLDALGHSKRIDKSNRYQHSDRGFNTTHVRVKSDGRRTVHLWDEGTTVAWQRTTYGAETSLKGYQKRVRDAVRLQRRKHGPESHFYDVGSTFRPMRRKRKGKQPRKGTTRSTAVFVNVALGTGSLEAMLFGMD